MSQGPSLVVKWLGLHAPNAGAQVQPLLRELRPTCFMAKPEKKTKTKKPLKLEV